MSPSRPLLLLIEDDVDDVYFFHRAIAKMELDCDLEAARDGEAALQRLKREPRPTHVLLDLKIPRMPGIEVLRWIRATAGFQSLPVIVLTSSNEKADLVRAKELGIDAYLLKPVGFSLLLDAVRRIAETWKIPSIPPPGSP